ncbi:hypothetical protein HWV62_17168 [Athelia sp. TMB]|nr:hypothetical protein HWV62_17168 [Athelia sp. TMB]
MGVLPLILSAPWKIMSNALFRISSVAGALLRYAPKSLYGRILRKKTYLLSLPLELLEEVVKNLDWLELLRIRMTCKALHHISKTRGVRVQLVKRAQACDPYHTPLDRAIERYTADELEDWAMRRLTQFEKWPPNCSQMSPRQRSFYPNRKAEHSILLPGGRWLVSTLAFGGLVVTDLDAPEPSHQSIWEPREDDDKWPAMSLVYHIDEEAPELTFNLVLDRCDPASDLDDVKVYFWRVSLSEDGTKFTAQMVNSFWTSGEYLWVDAALTNEYFVHISGGGGGHHCVELFHWRETTSDTYYKSSLRVKSTSPPVC